MSKETTCARESKKKGDHALGAAGILGVFRVLRHNQLLLAEEAQKGAGGEDAGECYRDRREVSRDAGPHEEADRGVDRVADKAVWSGGDQAPLGGVCRRVETSRAKSQPSPQHEKNRRGL